ncbi:MAG TPA: polysaccharide deacetylase family protein, partial [Burkholderiales bacterium]|nr:polysaccharide deacetylase family protein [Burkholderiales bacterium]
ALPTHGRFEYSPLPQRPDYSWPGNKRLAMYVALNIETFGFGMEVGPVLGNALPMPDQRAYSWREYGNRIGFWRLLELFDELKLPAAHLVNSYLYDTHPAIIEAIRKRGDEVVGHGRTNSEKPGILKQADEKTLIKEATAAITRYEGRAPAGWMTPMMMQSTVTPDLLKEAGYRYMMDWPCDDQPYWLRTRAGPLLYIPYPVETNDFGTTLQLHHDPVQFMDTVVRQFEEMIEQSARQPLVFALSLHTMIMGQPHRLRALRDGLRRILAHPRFDRVWLTRPGEIAAYCESLPAGTVPGS